MVRTGSPFRPNGEPMTCRSRGSRSSIRWGRGIRNDRRSSSDSLLRSTISPAVSGYGQPSSVGQYAVMPPFSRRRPESSTGRSSQPSVQQVDLARGVIGKAGDDGPLDLAAHEWNMDAEVPLGPPAGSVPFAMERDRAAGFEPVAVVIGTDHEGRAVHPPVEHGLLHPGE